MVHPTFSSIMGNLCVVVFLVNNGADMNIPNQYEKKPLDISIENNHLIVSEFIKMKGTKSHFR